MNNSIPRNIKIARITVLMIVMQILTCLLPTIDIFTAHDKYYGSSSVFSTITSAVQRISIGEEKVRLSLIIFIIMFVGIATAIMALIMSDQFKLLLWSTIELAFVGIFHRLFLREFLEIDKKLEITINFVGYIQLIIPIACLAILLIFKEEPSVPNIRVCGSCNRKIPENSNCCPYCGYEIK